MNELLGNPVALTVLPPFAAGLLLGVLAWLSGGNRVVMAVAWGLGMLLVYWLLEGVPAFPPAAAKQKLGYLLLAAVPLGALFATLPVKSAWSWLAIDLPLTAALLWLGWNKLASGENPGLMLIALVLAALLGIALLVADSLLKATPVEKWPELPFLVPAAWMLTAIAGSVVAATGLFLGMAQMLGALAALLGGALLVNFLSLVVTGRGFETVGRTGGFAVGFAVSCANLLTLLLGPSPSFLALLVLATCPLMSLAVLKWASNWLPAAAFLRPILAGVVIAIPAIIASLIAVLTGTSPFV